MTSQKRTPVTTASRSKQEEWMLPEFIGIGHTLEQAKLNRKRTFEQYLQISNRVAHFEKEYSKTSKSIDNNKKALSKIIEIRSRRNSDKKEKDSYQKRLRAQEQRARLQATYIKQHNQAGRREALRSRTMRVKQASKQVKDLLRKEFSWKKELDELTTNWMIDNFNEIEQGKVRGRQRVNAYMSDRNSKALKDYTERIADEKRTTERLEKEINRLSIQQMTVLNRLKDSAAQEEALRATINKASELNIESLEQKLKSSRPSSAQRSKFHLKTSSDIGKNEKSAQLSPAARIGIGMNQSLNPERQCQSCSCKKHDSPKFLTNSQTNQSRYRRKRNHRKRRLIELF